MPVYELLITAVDEPEAHRKKAGDVVAIRPTGWKWGKKEKDKTKYLIVTVEDDRNLEELNQLIEGYHPTAKFKFAVDLTRINKTGFEKLSSILKKKPE
jgi:hypothetical protein